MYTVLLEEISDDVGDDGGGPHGRVHTKEGGATSCSELQCCFTLFAA